MKHFIIKKKKKKILHQNGLGFRFMVFHATFKNISVIWWRSVLLVEHRPVASNFSAHHHLSCEFESRSWRAVLDTIVCDKVCQLLATGRCSTNKTDRHHITEIFLKVAGNTINLNPKPFWCKIFFFFFFIMKCFIIHFKKKKKKILHQNGLGFRFMVFPATFKNISVIWWRSVLLVEHRPVASNW
jgi:hypothetical protein